MSIEHKIFSCLGKAKFSHEKAKRKVKEYGMYYYHCRYCNQYHLTKQPTYESVMESEDNQ